MASLIPGFEYDIFISYRHNDNRSGWVTEFVKALEEELASTIKEPVSIYFDTNPHDGLLETHNVDKSLEGKLKCLIFIPIISQTYCDPKSFAWQHEFCAFNKMAKAPLSSGEGQRVRSFGRDIKLSNGNVASRILPIKIHDLDADDKATIENEIGGVLRAIEFIYKEAGVNRPLETEDKKEDNVNKTAYRNQVNKVANAIKELITGVRQSNHIPLNEEIKKSSIPESSRKKITGIVASLVALGLVSFSYYYFGGFGNKIEASLDKSIAVLPFENMSNDPEQEYVGDGVAEEIINVLAQSNDLKVIARSSSFQYKGKNEDLRKIGYQLGVAHVLEGSVRKSGDSLRITAQLIKTKDGVHLWSKVFKKRKGDIFAIQDEIAKAVADAFKISMSDNIPTTFKSDRNEEAYKLYLQGRFFYERAGEKDFKLAEEYLQKSVSLDSGRAIVWTFLANCKFLLNRLGEANKYLQKSFKLDPKLSETLIIMIERALHEYEIQKAKKLFTQVLQLKSSSPMVLRSVSGFYGMFGQDQECFRYAKQAVELDPLQPFSLGYLGDAYMKLKNYKEAEIAYRKALELSSAFLHGRASLASVLIAEGDFQQAAEEIKKIDDELEHKLFSCVIAFKLDDKSESDRQLNRLKSEIDGEWYDLFVYAGVHAFRNEPEEAINDLEKAYQTRRPGLIFFLNNSAFNDIRTNSRFVALMKKMELIE